MKTPSWNYLEIVEEEPSAVAVLFSALAEVVTLWWRKYMAKGGAAK